MGWWYRFTNTLTLAAAKTPDDLVQWLPNLEILSAVYPKGSKQADIQKMMIEAERRLFQFPDDIRISALQRGLSHKDDFVRNACAERLPGMTGPPLPHAVLDEHRIKSPIRLSIIFDAIGSAAVNVGVAIFSRTVNRLVPEGGLIALIGIVSAWILLGLMIRTDAGLKMPPNTATWAICGAGWGVLWGIYPGVVLGWGGGPSGHGWGDMPQLGLVPWISISVVFFGLVETFGFLALARKWKNE